MLEKKRWGGNSAAPQGAPCGWKGTLEGENHTLGMPAQASVCVSMKAVLTTALFLYHTEYHTEFLKAHICSPPPFQTTS